MSVRKAELEAINRKLQEALGSKEEALCRLEADRQELAEDNRYLTMRLSQCRAQLNLLSTRYRRLTRYIRKLRAWLALSEK